MELVASTWAELKTFLQPPTHAGENKVWPQFFWRLWQTSLLAGHSESKRFAFFFNQSLVRVGTLTLQSVWSVNCVNGCVIYQNSWCTGFKTVWKPIERRMPALCSTAFWTNIIHPEHSKEAFRYNSTEGLISRPLLANVRQTDIYFVLSFE